MIVHLTRATRWLIFWLLIVFAILSTVMRIVLPGIQEYKSELETKISSVLEVPVTIGTMRAGLQGFNPELVLKDIGISSTGGNKPAITLREIRIGLDVLEIILDRNLLSATMITLIGAELSVTRNEDGSISVQGLKASDEQPSWLLDGGRYEMLDSNVTWQDKKRHGEVLHFGHVDFFIDNDFGIKDHQINIYVKLDDQFGDDLRLSMHFNGNIFVSANVDALLYIEGNNVHLAELLAGDLPLGLQFNSGISDFKLWSEWHDTRMISLMGEIKVRQSQVTMKNEKPFSLEQLTTDFRWHNHKQQWQLEVRNFHLQTDKKKWPAANFSIWVEGDEENPFRNIGVNVSNADINEVCDLLQLSSQLDAKQAKLLKQLDPKGQIKDLLIFADLDNNKFAVNGGFENISVSAQDNVPEVSNFSGFIKGSKQQGYLRLATFDSEVYFPDLFRNSLELKKLTGKVSWTQTKENWILSSNMIELDFPDIQSRNRVQIKIPKQEGNTFMDYQIYFFNGRNAAIAKKYFPVGVMDEGIVDWLDQAFYEGDISQGGGIFYGDLVDYPFSDGQGVFEVLFNVEAGDLFFAPGWPHAYDINAEILFFRESLQVTFRHARISGAKITHAVGSIDSLFKFNPSEHFVLKGEVEGTIGQTMTFLSESPLADEADKVLGVIAPEGATNISLNMKIPLLESADIWLEGVAGLENAELSILPLDLPVTAINGDLHFNKQGVYGKGIKAIALGHPIDVDINNEQEQSRIRVNGHTDVENLQAQFPSSWWSVAGGQGDYSLLMTLPVEEDVSTKLLLSSDLQGFFLDLPGSLAKSELQNRPFYLHFDFASPDLLHATMNYDNVLQADFQLDRDKQELYAADILYGRGRVEHSRQPGVRVTVNQEYFSALPWLDFNALNKDQPRTMSARLEEIQFNTRHLVWQKKDQGSFDLHLQRNGQQWQGDVRTHMVAGKLNLPVSFNADSRISLNMQYIDLSALSELSMSGEALSPVDFPMLNIKSQNLYWRSVNLGKLVMEAEHIKDGLAFNRVDITAEDWKLLMQGSCTVDGDSIVTESKGTFSVHSLGDFLAQMNFTNEMRESKAKIDFALQWDGAPYQFSLAELNGNVEMKIKEGRLLGIEPGVGRMLGAFDLAQWKRRVRMDFSDIYAEGLSFNGIKGSFYLADGLADTNDLVIDAVAAKFEIRGQTDLLTQNYNQQITVTPKSSAVIPFAGTIAGLMVKTLTGTHPDSLTSSHYSLKGTWDEPKLKKLKRKKGVKQETMRRKMGFSRLENEKNRKEGKHE